ncbi:poly(U)-specific 3'-to-5' RNA exonuclease [Actinomortierella wolfii]|nr:poly(U)-specific 3'-to-5' RNA exonuclease [Actinomortierella wolfii]
MSLVQYGSSSEDSSEDEGHVSSNANVSLNNRLKAETEAVQKGVKRSREEEGDRERMALSCHHYRQHLQAYFKSESVLQMIPHCIKDGRVSLTEELQDIISTLVERAKALVPSLETIPEPHISLTRLFRLPTLHVDRFKRDVRSVFEKRTKIKLSFSGLQCFSNDEQTRSFLTLRVGSGHAELESMMADMDQIAIKYGQPTFYDNPEFHASFAWALGGHTLDQSTVEGILHQGNIGEIHKELDTDIRQCIVQAERVSWKIGAKIESLALK